MYYAFISHKTCQFGRKPVVKLSIFVCDVLRHVSVMEGREDEEDEEG